MLNFIDYYNIPLWAAIILLIVYNIWEFYKQKNINKSNENLKGRIQNKLDDVNHKFDLQNHFSEYKFDLEIKIYQDLFEKMVSAEDWSDYLLKTIDTVPEDHKEFMDEMHKRDKNFCDKFNAFTTVSRKNKPFYKKDFYSQIDDITQIMQKLHNLFTFTYFSSDMKSYAIKHRSDADLYHKEIHQKIDKLTDDVRNYINTLTKY